MALRTRVASVLPLLWLDDGCVAMLVWLDCLLRNSGTSWLQHGLDWQHFQVDAVGGGDVGLGIQLLRSARWMWREHVVSRAAIWSTCCSCCSCWWWLHRSVLGCESRCDAAHATWSFKWHEKACERLACDVVMSAGGTAAAPSCQVHDCAGCWQAAPVSDPARAYRALARRTRQCSQLRWSHERGRHDDSAIVPSSWLGGMLAGGACRPGAPTEHWPSGCANAHSSDGSSVVVQALGDACKRQATRKRSGRLQQGPASSLVCVRSEHRPGHSRRCSQLHWFQLRGGGF